MLGSSLKFFFNYADFLNGKSDIDLTKIPELKKYFKNRYYDIIIHTAAFTDLNFCEKNREKAFFLHSGIVSLLQDNCDRLIYISTNQIESKMVYYLSKRMGELEVIKRNNDLVIRTNLFGQGGLVYWAINSLKKKKKINGFTDVFFNPVHVDQLSEFIACNLHKYKGILNIGSDKIISKFEFIKLLSKKFELNTLLLEPSIKGNHQDLSIKLEDNFVKFSLSEGIEKLKFEK